jgi:hypothetical protein
MTQPGYAVITPEMVHAFFEAKRAELEKSGRPWDGRVNGKTEQEYYAKIAAVMNVAPVQRHSELGTPHTAPPTPSGQDLIGDDKPKQGKVEKWVDDTVGDPHRKVTKALGSERTADDVKDAAKGLKDTAKKAYSGKPKDAQSLLLDLAKMAAAVYLSSFTTVDKLHELDGWTRGVVGGALGSGPPSPGTRNAGHERPFQDGAQQGVEYGGQPEHRDKVKSAVDQFGRAEVLKAIWLRALENAHWADGDSPNLLASARQWTWD